MFIEQLHRSLGQPPHGRIGVARQSEQVSERQTELQQAQGGAHQVDVGRGVPLLAADRSTQTDPLALDSLDQRGGHARAL